jgi:hypothetical protein
MYRGNWGRALLSRAAAVAILCLATAWLSGVLGQLEIAETSKMSHQELKTYIREGAEAPFALRYAASLAGAALLVSLVELLGAGLRALVPAGVRTDRPLEQPLYH